MPKTISFHSYKGGTGKTTLACNLAAALAARGFKVALMDMDVYSPSFQGYFEQQHQPDNWINDFLTSSNGVKEIMYDASSLVANHDPGKLWIGYSNPNKQAIYGMDSLGITDSSRVRYVRKFIQLREDLIEAYDCDYIILDTSPGIRYWSINCLAVTDVLFLTLKFGDIDIYGTRNMARDIYDSFTRFGAKSYLILNQVAGYCIPNTIKSTRAISNKAKDSIFIQQQDQGNIELLSQQISMDVISRIPCYCDIQFRKKEFLTVLNDSDHPFAGQIRSLASSKAMAI